MMQVGKAMSDLWGRSSDEGKDEIVRAHVVVSGLVQGVAFRRCAVDEAERIGRVSGWVRNLPEGSVEVLAEGPRAEIEAFVTWLRRGPRHARVERVEISWQSPRGDLAPFDIGF